MGTESRHYGNGFVVSSEWSQNIVRYWKVSDRISVIQLRLKDDNTYTCKCISQREGIRKLKIQRKEKNLLSVINVYAPTTCRVDSNPNERTEFYIDLSTTMQEVKKKSCLVLIGGDFNAKIGKQPERDEICVGRFSRGRRNNAGQQLIDFCNMNNLFISNSAFKQPARHITTWHCKRKIDGKITNIYNQIDYIICPASKKHILRNSRSYSGTLTDSDHRLLITTLNIDLYRIYKPTKIIQEKQFNSYILAADKEKREEYSSKLKERIESLQEDEISWENVANHITEAAKEVVGFRTSNKNNRQNNSGVQKLSEKQKEIRLQISTW